MTFDDLMIGIDKDSSEYQKAKAIYDFAKKEDLEFLTEACEQSEKRFERCKAYNKWLKKFGPRICEACKRYVKCKGEFLGCTSFNYQYFRLNTEVSNDTGADVSWSTLW